MVELMTERLADLVKRKIKRYGDGQADEVHNCLCRCRRRNSGLVVENR